jgi:DNA repair exonuclease SbcCD ATPase subunit
MTPIKQEVSTIRNRFNELQSDRKFLEKSIDSEKVKLFQSQKRYETGLKAREILQVVAKNVQSNLEFHISSLVTLALNSIFPNTYEFVAKFELKRGATECMLGLVKTGETEEIISPLDAVGGGLCDVVSLALRLSYWFLRKNRPTLILDEPMRNLSRNYHESASILLKTLSKDLGLQLILVSHIPEILVEADNVIEI